MRKRWIAGALALAVFASPLAFIKGDDVAAQAKRIYGQDRYETATQISKEGWGQKADTVILARGDKFPDALAGTPLAYKENAPILLTESKQLSAKTKSEISRLKPSKVIILGGKNAISSSVESELKKMNITVERIAGDTRYETAVKIAEKVGFDKKMAIVADGRNFPDALAVAPYAAKNGYPILLVDKNMPREVKNVLKNINKTIVVGGENAVSKNVFNQLPNATRIAGSDRYATASAIVKYEYKGEVPSTYVATGQNFADALTGSVLAAKDGKPVILVKKDQVPNDIMKLVKDKNTNNFTAFGGPNAISDKVLEQLQNKGQKVENENPAYDPNYPDYDQWINYTRIAPQAWEYYKGMEQRIKNGTATAKDYYGYRFKVEELLWTYYKGPIPASPYEQEMMNRLAKIQFGVDSWDKVSERDKAVYHGSVGLFGVHTNVIIESFGFTNDGKLEWLVVRPAGMRHAFKLTIEDPVGSVVRNRAWAGHQDDDFDAEYAKLATPELLKLLVETKVPVGIGWNGQLMDDWNERGYPYDDYSKYREIREREIKRWYADSVVKEIFGGDLSIVVGGNTTWMTKADLEKGSKLIPPQLLERQPYEKGTNKFIETDRY